MLTSYYKKIIKYNHNTQKLRLSKIIYRCQQKTVKKKLLTKPFKYYCRDNKIRKSNAKIS